MALALRFEGRYSSEQIAQKISTDCQIETPASTIRDWWSHPEFQERLALMRENLLDTCDELGIAYVRKEQRIVSLAQMAESARVEYEARTWLEEKRQIGRDVDGEPLYLTNESYNRDAHAAFRGALDDIAKELGARKVDAAVSQQPVMRRYILEPRS